MKALGITAILSLLACIVVFLVLPAMRMNQLKQVPGLELELQRTVPDWVSDSAARPMERLVRISSDQHSWLRSTVMPPEPLPSLRKLRHLEEVALQSDIAQQIDLRGCNALRSASLNLGAEGSSIVLSGLPALEFAMVNCAGTTPSDLRNCPKLKSVYARSPLLLGGSSGVKVLDLSGTATLPATDWAQLNRVETLDLNGLQSFPPLANPAGLRELNLRNFPSDQVPWESLVGLEEMRIYGAAGVVDLRSLKSLRWLYLADYDTNTRFQLPASLLDLRVYHPPGDVLDLSRLIEFDAAPSRLSFYLPGETPAKNIPADLVDGIERLILGRFDSCSDAAWQQLARAPQLSRVSSAGRPTAVAWKSLSTMPALEHLSITSHFRANVGNEPIVIDGFPALKELEVTRGISVSLRHAPSQPKITYSMPPSQRMAEPEEKEPGSRVLVTPGR